jgi:hypothetical protein
MTRRWIFSAALLLGAAPGCRSAGAATAASASATACRRAPAGGDEFAVAAEAGERAFRVGGSVGAFLARGLLLRPTPLHAAAARLFPDAVTDELALFLKVVPRASCDAATAAEVRAALAMDPATARAEVRVAAYRGRVFLSGPAGDPAVAAAAVERAAAVDGVRAVRARFGGR